MKFNGSADLVYSIGILHRFLVIVFIFFLVLRPFQDYFSSYETGQSVGGAKTGEPREKPPGTPASRTWFVPHVASVVFSIQNLVSSKNVV